MSYDGTHSLKSAMKSCNTVKSVIYEGKDSVKSALKSWNTVKSVANRQSKIRTSLFLRSASSGRTVSLSSPDYTPGEEGGQGGGSIFKLRSAN